MGDNSAAFGQEIEAHEAVSTVIDDDHKKLFYYAKWHIGDYISGTMGMTPEQEGIYMRFLMRLYDRGKPFPDDDRFMVTVMGLSTVRVWKRFKDSLAAIGKIIIRNGCLTNARFERERLTRSAELKKQADSARKRWANEREKKEAAQKFGQSLVSNLAETSAKLSANVLKKTNENNEISITPHMPPRDERLEKKEKERCPNGHLSPDEPTTPAPKTIKASEAAQMAFDLYNEMAKRNGLPQCRILNDARKRALVLRIKEAGGMDGFKRALANLEKSAYCLGQNDRGWVATRTTLRLSR
jgi:uncharacterized protein YdaU (DUF1376 family)